MSLDVLPADIGQNGVVAMTFRVQNQGALAAMAGLSKQARAEVKPQLHRHVEARQAGGANLNTRKIVDALVTLADHRSDLADADLGGRRSRPARSADNSPRR